MKSLRHARKKNKQNPVQTRKYIIKTFDLVYGFKLIHFESELINLISLNWYHNITIDYQIPAHSQIPLIANFYFNNEVSVKSKTDQ